MSDVIIPEIFAPYFKQKAYKLSNVLNSGIASSDAGIVITKGGKTVNLPFWKRAYATDEVPVEGTAATIHKIVAAGDVAVIHTRAIAYSSSHLSALFSGDDPMGAMADFLAQEWEQNMQKTLISTLKGAFSCPTMAGSVLDISGNAGAAGVINAEAMIDAQYLIGDAFGKLSGIMMHSAVLAKLKKLDLIDFEKQSDADKFMPFYMGQRVIVDDALAPETGNGYPIYFFGNGAVAYNENMSELRTETDRDALTDEDYLISRRCFTMHVRGIKWKGTAAGVTPTNAELETADNWELVDDRKNVAITKLIAKIA